ncbi:MAG TPA: sigma-70 family RNA polymerase sigma factor [Polyangia bacterium]|nr:sigma-70 family RNA polymerase sigma factor [Polyangia bacterium]
MEQSDEWVSLFLEAAPVPKPWPTGGDELGRLLCSTWEIGRGQWPGVALPAKVFVRHLARCLATPEADQSPVELLKELASRDFYLACACAHEVPGAAQAFDQHYLARLPSYLQHMNQPQAFIDDVCQTVREKLLVRTAEELPKIADYTGRGALMGWVRIIALRMAVRMLHSRKDGEHEGDGGMLAALPSPGMDPELEVIKRTYQKEFLQAMNDAFGSLSSEHRYLLRLYFVDHLSTTEMATLFRVNQSTISRRLQTARQAVYEETKRLLQKRLLLSSGEFHSLIQVVDSQLNMSLSRMLGEEDVVGPSHDGPTGGGGAAPRRTPVNPSRK